MKMIICICAFFMLFMSAAYISSVDNPGIVIAVAASAFDIPGNNPGVSGGNTANSGGNNGGPDTHDPAATGSRPAEITESRDLASRVLMFLIPGAAIVAAIFAYVYYKKRKSQRESAKTPEERHNESSRNEKDDRVEISEGQVMSDFEDGPSGTHDENPDAASGNR